MGIYTRLIRPLLFTLPPERAQKLAEAALRAAALWKVTRPFLQLRHERLRCEIAGIPLRNPVGLAAGYDKDGRLTGGLANMGFGYLIVGTVVADPREGNPRPRLLREPGKGGLINSLGFPSQGLDRVLLNLGRASLERIPLLASISGLSVEEISRCYRSLQPLASGIELNISSPNTEGIRVFQEPEKLEELLAALRPIKSRPLFLKLPPYFDDAQKDRVLELVDVCLQYSVEGVTAVNTWPQEDGRLAVGRGGLSGKPLFPHMLRIVKEVRTHAGEQLVINACGGIFSGEDALQAVLAGANTVQLFTSLVYQGPGLMKRINRHLVRFAEKEGIASVDRIGHRGSPPA